MRDPRLVEFAKTMRIEMTEPERRLWERLRAKRFQGIKFRRQNVVGPYIADSYAREVMTIVEVDGDTHGFQADYDAVRDRYFRTEGYCVIRFSNRDVMTNMEGVLTMIAERITSPLPTLSPEGERAV